MKKIYFPSLNIFVLLCFATIFFTSGCASVQKEKIISSEPSKITAQSPTESKEGLAQPTEASQESLKKTEVAAQAVKKEAEVYKKEVELEKKKAQIEVKEAEAAKKEAAIIKKTTSDTEEIKTAIEKVKKEEEEARVASAKVGAAKEKMQIAQEKAKLSEEELAIAKEKVAIADAQAKERRKVLYAKLAQTGAVIFIGYLLLFIVVGIINRQIKELRVRHVVRKNAAYLINFLIILSIVFVWVQNVTSLTIIFSAMGAGLALALQEMILCVAGWFTILVRRPFEVGDRVDFGGVKGDVIDVRLIHTTLLEMGDWVGADQSTGRIVNVPNSAVFKKEIYNYNRGFEFIWDEIKIVVTFESDWKRGEEIMMKHAIEHSKDMESIMKRKIDIMSRNYMINIDQFNPSVYVDIKDSGVELSLRYLTEDKKRRATKDMLSREILDDFEKEKDVNFAYTTYRIVK